MTTLLEGIQDAINRHSAETESDTPDFILAQYLRQCLTAFNIAVNRRENWYGRDSVGGDETDPAMKVQPATPESEADPRNPNIPGHEAAGYVSPPTT